MIIYFSYISFKNIKNEQSYIGGKLSNHIHVLKIGMGVEEIDN